MKQTIKIGTVKGLQIQRHLDEIYEELILETYFKRQ